MEPGSPARGIPLGAPEFQSPNSSVAPRGTPQRSTSGNVNALLVLARYSSSCSASERIDLSAYVLQKFGLSGWQSNQLQHLFDEGIEDESCAAVLEIDAERVQQFREHLQRQQKSERQIISPDERTTIQELFERQITEGTCANITHVPVDSVKKIKEAAEANKAVKRGWVSGALTGAASAVIGNLNTPQSTPRAIRISSGKEEEPVPSELSGRQCNQLQQMFEKSIDDESCAKILKTDVELVREFHKGLQSGETSQKDIISKEEQAQLTLMIDRQMSLETCANVLHMPLNAVKQFKEDNDSLRHRLAQRDISGVAGYIVRRCLLTATKVQEKTVATVKDPTFKVTAATTATGSVVGGVAGGSTGTVVGGTVGGAIGVIPALFTFGLSIPIGVAIGSGIGLCTGSSIGAAAGGASGYYYRDKIRNSRLISMGASFLGKGKALAITDCASSKMCDSDQAGSSDEKFA